MKNGVKNIQAAAYNGSRPVHKKRKELTILMYILYFKEKIPKNGQHFLLDKQHLYIAKISRRNKSAWHARNRYCNCNIYHNYRIFVNSFRGNYSRKETIQGRKLYEEIRCLKSREEKIS